MVPNWLGQTYSSRQVNKRRDDCARLGVEVCSGSSAVVVADAADMMFMVSKALTKAHV